VDSKYLPRRKVAGAGLGGIALAPLIVWLVGLAGVEMPGEVAAIASGLIALAVGYFVPERTA
jgi:L-lactate permease